MTIEEKKIKASELREFYHNNIVLDNFFTRNPKYFAPTHIPELNWILHFYISFTLLGDVAGIYHLLTGGRAIFLDIIDFVGKSSVYIFELIF